MNDVCEFVPIIETVLNNWSGLKLCIDNGMGGDPLQVTRKLQKMIDNIHTALSQDDFYDLVDLLEDTLDAEFDTELQDESAPEVATVLFELYKGWHEGRKEEVLDQVKRSMVNLGSILDNRPGMPGTSSGDIHQARKKRVPPPPPISDQEGTSDVPMAEGDPWTVVSRRK
ncbi:Pre-rRNA-processing protein TSR2 [Nesidiocoris tenuis]|uniref:Pre-rRNA-processing protein TSR2 homolog n=1 Tax=Nesidiocoris tenuis TaxID=355587 RepID=A0ABN7B022_9HEMI|nr:Pre-rRNA-processing protein TSR2 [Nesidiocoris tenuis]